MSGARAEGYFYFLGKRFGFSDFFAYLCTLKICINVKYLVTMPNGKKHKRHKMATHKRKKRLRKNRHKSK